MRPTAHPLVPPSFPAAINDWPLKTRRRRLTASQTNGLQRALTIGHLRGGRQPMGARLVAGCRSAARRCLSGGHCSSRRSDEVRSFGGQRGSARRAAARLTFSFLSLLQGRPRQRPWRTLWFQGRPWQWASPASAPGGPSAGLGVGGGGGGQQGRAAA